MNVMEINNDLRDLSLQVNKTFLILSRMYIQLLKILTINFYYFSF